MNVYCLFLLIFSPTLIDFTDLKCTFIHRIWPHYAKLGATACAKTVHTIHWNIFDIFDVEIPNSDSWGLPSPKSVPATLFVDIKSRLPAYTGFMGKWSHKNKYGLPGFMRCLKDCQCFMQHWKQIDTKRTFALLAIHKNIVSTQEYCAFSMCFVSVAQKDTKSIEKTWKNAIFLC